MKIQKLILFALTLVMLSASLQVNSIWANRDTQEQMFLPLVLSTQKTSSFGMHIKQRDFVDIVADANAHWVHYNQVLWSEIQPGSPNSDWDSNYAKRIDQDLKAMGEAGMEVIMTIRSTPEWARDHKYYCGRMRDENIQDFANFVGEVVARYSQPPYNVTYYEIWNEPDDRPLEEWEVDYDVYTTPYGCWGDPGKKGDPGSDPFGGGSFYTQVLKAVYPQVKAANPAAKVVLGSLLLWGDPSIFPLNRLNFFEGILASGGGQYLDVASYHAYTAYNPTKSAIQAERDVPMWPGRNLPGTNRKDPNTVGHVMGKLDYLRRMMDKYGVVQKPVMVTEAALNTWDPTLPDYDPGFEAAKADYVVWLYTRNLSKGIYVTSWYHLHHYGWCEVKTGLLDRENNPLPAYEAYKVLAHTLNAFAYRKDLNLSSGILGFEFSSINRRIWVLFSEDGAQKSIPTPSGFVRAFDLFDNPVSPSEGQINFSRPIYIELMK